MRKWLRTWQKEVGRQHHNIATDYAARWTKWLMMAIISPDI
jgi:hypothetical protein